MRGRALFSPEQVGAESRVSHLGSRQQFICKAFSQRTRREGLRGIAPCLHDKPVALDFMWLVDKDGELASTNARGGLEAEVEKLLAR